MIWDTIIVGAGSAGSALAGTLGPVHGRTLVVEAGGADTSPFLKVAAGQPWASNTFDWGYVSQPDASRGGATERWKRGRVVGGSSSINGTIYVRGAAADFDRWAMPGWRAEDVMPVFAAMERSDQPGMLRGHDGPLHVRTVRHPHRITRAFVEAAAAAGLPYNEDYNGAAQDGVGYIQFSQRGRWRCSAADAFLKPAVKRGAVTLLRGAHVERILFEGKRAAALRIRRKGKFETIEGRRIVLCAGAINSPALLLRSGVGDPDELKALGIPLVHALPGVGRNLQEHACVPLRFAANIPTRNLTEGPGQWLGVARDFLMAGESLLTNLFEGIAFLKSSPDVHQADLQLIFLALNQMAHPDGRARLAPFPSYSLLLINSHPASRGRIRLASPDPDAPPSIEPNLLGTDEDVARLGRGVELVRKIVAQQPLASLTSKALSPAADVGGQGAVESFVRAHTGIAFHPVGTCQMGKGSDAVVGSDLRVHGLENIRVADASIMPSHISANINAACMMIGIRLGEMLAAEQPPR